MEHRLTIKETLANNKKKVKRLQDEILDSSKKLFNQESQQLFIDYPDLIAFRWRQYTPYFNDGDECVFHTQDSYIKLASTEEDAGDYNDGFESYWGNDEPAVSKAVTEFLKQFDDDAYLFMFGNHVQITVTKDGVEVDEYDHD